MPLDLHTGRSYWLRPRRPAVARDPLRRDLDTDALVIGAGIAGATVADALIQSGLSVVVVDAGEPGMGSTIASTALLQYDLDVPLTALTGALGVEDAQRAYRVGIEALALINQRTSELGIAFDRLPSLYVATFDDRTRALREEFEARRRAGIAVDWVPREELIGTYGLDAHAAILSCSAATTDPYALTIGLLHRAQAGGARVFSPTRIAGISRQRDLRLAHSADDGPTITARWIVWATGYESAALLPPGLVNINSTYAIAAAARGGPEPLRRCLWWEFADPYMYSRWDGDNLLLGGEDEEFFDAPRRDLLIPEKARTLAAKYAALVPGVEMATTHAWAGAFATTPDGLGYMGPLPDDPQVMFALGFGGNGMTMAAMAARLIADLVMGRPNPDLSLYGFGRAAVRAGGWPRGAPAAPGGMDGAVPAPATQERAALDPDRA